MPTPSTNAGMFRFLMGAGYTLATQAALSNSSVVAADTGQLADIGDYIAYVTISTDTAGAFNIQHRNAANSANVTVAAFSPNGEEYRVFAAVNSDREYIFPFTTTAANERCRVIPNALNAGNFCAVIWFKRVG